MTAQDTVWTPAWGRLFAEAIGAWGAEIAAQPERFRPRVVAFLDALRQVRSGLDRIAALGVADPRVAALERRYAVLLAGVRADAHAVDAVGAAPIALVIGGVSIGLASVAWAVAAYQYTVHLREQTALLEKELVARVDASREGRTLPPSALSGTRTIGWALLGVLALGAVALAWRGGEA